MKTSEKCMQNWCEQNCVTIKQKIKGKTSKHGVKWAERIDTEIKGKRAILKYKLKTFFP